MLAIANKDGNKDTLLPAIWALRNLAYGNETAKTKIGKKGGVPALLKICCDQVNATLPASSHIC